MNIATTVLKQTTTTSARMSTSIHRTELSTLGSINFDKFNCENLCTAQQQQQHQLQTVTKSFNTNNKQISNNNTTKTLSNSSNSAKNNSGILMESKTLANVIRTTNSDNNRRHSFTLQDERLLKILSAPPDEPLFTNDKSNNQLVNGSNGDKDVVAGANLLMQYEAATSSIHNNDDGVVAVDDYENQPPSKHDKCIAANHEDENNMSPTPQKYFSPATWNKIQRDLSSPSASCRVRALRAMKSPTNSYYYNKSDDPQHVEKSLEPLFDEHPKTIQEVMKDVSVYVEYRSATDNRTAAVKGVIAKLGAKVNERLTKNTTHVVFKDGLQSTYNKAKIWNIPIVSVLWIEACKKHLVLMDPKAFPIENIEKYENPDLFGKAKRQKYIQPDTLMKNLHRKIPKAKLLLGLKKLDESNNSSLSSSTIASKSISSIPKLTQSKKTTTTTTTTITTPKVNTSRKSLSQKCDDKPKNTIRSMFEKQLIKSQIENSQIIETTANDTETMAVLENETNNEIIDDSTKINGTNVADETILVTGNLHKRLTRRNSITIHTPTKSTPTKSEMDSSSFLNSARKRRTLFTPSIKPTIEETDQSIESIHENKTINNTVPMELCDESASKKCNSQVRQLLDVELKNTPINVRNSMADGKRNLLKSTLRRGTIHTPQPMEETSVRNSTITPSQRRKTINVKSAIKKQSASPPELTETQSCDAILTPTNSVRDKALASSNLNTSSSSLVSTPLIKSMSQIHLDLIRKSTTKSILDEYTSTFSSTKAPLSGKRRTIANITMDIIKQRVENINRNVSFNQSTNEAQNDSIINDLIQTPNQLDKPAELVLQTNETEKPKPLGRRLFAPPSLFPENSPFSVATPPPKTDKKTAIKSAIKRKRTEIIAEKPIKIADEKKLKKPSRRSTLFFEEAPIKKSTSSQMESMTETATETTTQTNATENISPPVLVYTSMHQPQIDFINEAIKKLGKYKLEDKVNQKTTHLIAFDTRRTINMLRGIIRGIWILSYDWILESMEANGWKSESEYELKSFSKAVEVNRIERQAFGRKYRMDIFRNFDKFYISSNCACKNLTELITLCYGKVTQDKHKAHYIIAEVYRKDLHKRQVHANWILDSISAGKVAKIDKYLLRSSNQQNKQH